MLFSSNDRLVPAGTYSENQTVALAISRLEAIAKQSDWKLLPCHECEQMVKLHDGNGLEKIDSIKDNIKQ